MSAPGPTGGGQTTVPRPAADKKSNGNGNCSAGALLLNAVNPFSHCNLGAQAANGAGQVWKVDTSGAICVLAGGLRFPSAVNFGVGLNSENLYVVGFDGNISELANVLP